MAANDSHLSTRRVVAGNSPTGESIVISDEELQVVSRGLGEGINGSEIWLTDSMPADASSAGEAAQRQGFIKHYNDYNYVGSGQGSTSRITGWEPGHALFRHRTQTVDYDVVLEGEIDLQLDGGKVVHLKAGDAVVLRQCRHTWINRSNAMAVTAFILLDAAPFESTTGPLAVEFPPPEG